MTLHTILFTSRAAIICRRDGAVFAPSRTVTRASLPLDQQTQWDITVAALHGLLETGEAVLGAEINAAPRVAVAWEPVDDGGGLSHDEPTAWRDTLHVVIRIRTADGGQRRIWLGTEQFSVTAARDALLGLWEYFDAL